MPNHHANDKPLCDVCHCAHYDIAPYGLPVRDLCPDCVRALPTCQPVTLRDRYPALAAVDRLIHAADVARSMPPQDAGLGYALGDLAYPDSRATL